jgi:hypothetical protein
VRHFSRAGVDVAKISPSVIVAHTLPARYSQYFRELHAVRASEERILDADKWDEKIRIAGDADSPSPTRLPAAKAQREFE